MQRFTYYYYYSYYSYYYYYHYYYYHYYYYSIYPSNDLSMYSSTHPSIHPSIPSQRFARAGALNGFSWDPRGSSPRDYITSQLHLALPGSPFPLPQGITSHPTFGVARLAVPLFCSAPCFALCCGRAGGHMLYAQTYTLVTLGRSQSIGLRVTCVCSMFRQAHAQTPILSHEDATIHMHTCASRGARR